MGLNGICASDDSAHPQRTQNIDTVQTVVSSFTSQLLPFTKVQVSSIMDGTSDDMKCQAGAIVGHQE
jgi:hypothetical protein